MNHLQKEKDIETQREFWSKVAKENGWFFEPFYVQIWRYKNGKIKDSIYAPKGVSADIVLEREEISYRTENGWMQGGKRWIDLNNPRCNKCGGKLSIAPNQRIYCDAVHKDIKKNK